MLKIQIYEMTSLKETRKQPMVTFQMPLDRSEAGKLIFTLDKLCRKLSQSGLVRVKPYISELDEFATYDAAEAADKVQEAVREIREDQRDLEFVKALRTVTDWLADNMPI